MKPKRIQLRRSKGWRKPEGAIVCTRPGKWGNPFWFVQMDHGAEMALRLFRETALGCWNPGIIPKEWPDSYVSEVYDAHQNWMKRIQRHPVEVARFELRGHDLCCWCKLESACHVDILLEIANA